MDETEVLDKIRDVVADKLDAWADMAELMGDDRGAGQLREHAQVARMRAMHLLDD